MYMQCRFVPYFSQFPDDLGLILLDSTDGLGCILIVVAFISLIEWGVSKFSRTTWGRVASTGL